jgi:hypothetical protein
MEFVLMQRKSGQDESSCKACGAEISSHDPGITPKKGIAYKRPPTQ